MLFIDVATCCYWSGTHLHPMVWTCKTPSHHVASTPSLAETDRVRGNPAAITPRIQKVAMTPQTSGHFRQAVSVGCWKLALGELAEKTLGSHRDSIVPWCIDCIATNCWWWCPEINKKLHADAARSCISWTLNNLSVCVCSYRML